MLSDPFIAVANSKLFSMRDVKARIENTLNVFDGDFPKSMGGCQKCKAEVKKWSERVQLGTMESLASCYRKYDTDCISFLVSENLLYGVLTLPDNQTLFILARGRGKGETYKSQCTYST
jgi:hypothetical protein